MTEMSFAPKALSGGSSKPEFNYAVRQSETPQKSPPPYSIRFTWEERDQLTRDAGKKSWAAHIRECVFNETVSKRRKTQQTSADLQAIARLGAMLGQTNIPNNLNQLARAANTDCLVMDEHTKQTINEACAYVAEMRQMLVTALGVKVDGGR